MRKIMVWGRELAAFFKVQFEFVVEDLVLSADDWFFVGIQKRSRLVGLLMDFCGY